MRHEHLVVTVEAELKERIDADLDAGESLEAWVADAIEQKLDREVAADDPKCGDDPDPDDEYDEGFEYVDDCAI